MASALYTWSKDIVMSRFYPIFVFMSEDLFNWPESTGITYAAAKVFLVGRTILKSYLLLFLIRYELHYQMITFGKVPATSLWNVYCKITIFRSIWNDLFCFVESFEPLYISCPFSIIIRSQKMGIGKNAINRPINGSSTKSGMRIFTFSFINY